MALRLVDVDSFKKQCFWSQMPLSPGNLTPDILPRQCSSGKKDPQKKLEQHVFYWSKNRKSLTSFILFLSLSHEPVSSKHVSICSEVLYGRSSWMVFIVIPLSIFSAWTNEMVEDNLEGGEGWQERKHTGALKGTWHEVITINIA